MQFYLAFLAVITGVRHIGKREDPGDEVEVISSFCLMITCLWAAVDASAFTCVNLFSDNLTIFKPFEIRYCSVMTWCLRYKRFMFRQGFFIGRRMTLKTLRFSALANRSGGTFLGRAELELDIRTWLTQIPKPLISQNFGVIQRSPRPFGVIQNTPTTAHHPGGTRFINVMLFSIGEFVAACSSEPSSVALIGKFDGKKKRPEKPGQKSICIKIRWWLYSRSSGSEIFLNLQKDTLWGPT